MRAASFSPNNLNRNMVVLTDAKDKATAVADLTSSWEQQSEKDKKYRQFFEEDQETKFSMLAEWVAAKNPVQKFFFAPIQQAGQEPVLGRGKKFHHISDVLEYFNNLLNPSDVTLCLDALKKRWGQARYRDNLKEKKKKQCNVVLTSKSLGLLDALADKHLLSRAQILEVLIRSEAEQKRYLSEWIKVAKSLE